MLKNAIYCIFLNCFEKQQIKIKDSCPMIIMKPMSARLHGLLITLLFMSSCMENSVFWLNEADLSLMKSGNGSGASLPDKSVQGSPLSIGRIEYSKGIGTSAISTLMLNLDKKGQYITGKAGVDDMAKGETSIRFYIVGDRKTLWDSGVMNKGDSARTFRVRLAGIEKLGMLAINATDGISRAYADWVETKIFYSGKFPPVSEYLIEKPYLLTPPSPAEPEINGPVVYAVRPSSPFIYRIPCTGSKPIRFSAESLPEGLVLDSLSGIITGHISTPGKYLVTLMASNFKGESKKDFEIIVGEKLMLTPSMGWNSWYFHKRTVSDSIIRNASDIMISSGMADYGYQYINIDDCWGIIPGSKDPVNGGPARDKKGRLLGNLKFPDMNSLTDYIHSKGLKAGIYTSPGSLTCGGFEGTYGHDSIDTRTFADWGFDFLKYDWCSYEKISPDHSQISLKAPFELMSREIKEQKRDMVFNICQYGMGNVWDWAGEISQSWRTTDDIAWMKNLSMPGFYYIGRSNADHWQYAGPGHWNDPDYIIMGYIRDPFRKNQVSKTELSQSEQFFYMSMWSLMAAPLIYSGDMGQLDEYLLNVLCNNEVIDIDLDTLGKQGRIIREGNNEMIMAKELVNGELAVGLFHVTGPVKDPDDFPLGKEKKPADKSKVMESLPAPDPAGYFNWGSPVKIRISGAELGLTGKFKVRDVWRQKDLGEFSGYFEAEVPYHGVSLIRISR